MKQEKEFGKQKKTMKLSTKITLCVLVTLVFVCGLLLSPVFAVKEVVIDTENAELKEAVSAHMKDAYGENGFLYVMQHVNGLKNIDALFSLRAKTVEDAIIFQEPALKKVRVKYVFPNTINITFTERTPAYLIFSSGVYVCADEEGYVLSVHTDSAERDLPVVRGIDLMSYKIGQTISTGKEEQMRALNALFNEIVLCDMKNDAYKLSTHIEIVDVAEYNKIWLFIDERLSVNLGDVDNIEYKIPALKEILQTEAVQGKSGLIDFTVSDRPIFQSN